MNEFQTERSVAFMMPGPIHLFWTTGVFYLWVLRDRYRFVLVVPATYRSNARFEAVVRRCRSAEVVYLPGGNVFVRHFRYRKLFAALAARYRPAVLLLHNRDYPENLYAIWNSRRIVPKCLVVNYQNGRETLDWSTCVRDQLESGVLRLSRRGIPRSVARLAIKGYRTIRYWLDNRILPVALTGHSFYPLQDVYSYRPLPANLSRFSRSIHPGMDYTLAYVPVEAEQFRKHGKPNVIQVAHPGRTAGKEALEAIFGSGSKRHEILVLPTCGVPSRKIDFSAPATVIAEMLADRWIQALRVMRRRIPAAALGVKLHPSAASDPIWNDILCRFQVDFPDIQVYPCATPAEGLILRASIIVSDVSTTLWWAALMGGKTVISLDIFGFEGGVEMKRYQGIRYVTAVEQIDDLLSIKEPDDSERLEDDSNETILQFMTRISSESQ